MAPAWRAAPLPKAHCAAAAAIEATATEPWTEAQLLQELDAPAGRLFGLYAGETLCGAAVFQLAADEASLESVGRRKNFYKNPPEDALVMRAEL